MLLLLCCLLFFAVVAEKNTTLFLFSRERNLLAGKIELDAGLVVGSIASGTKIRTSQ